MLDAHDDALRYGGRHGVIDENAIMSAIVRPYVGYYRSIQRKAAALVESLCTNHGFMDGNKRTCLLMLDLLLDRSGYKLRPIPNEDINAAVEDMILSAVKHLMGFGDIERWMKKRIVKKQKKSRGG